MIVIDEFCKNGIECPETYFIITFPRPIQFGDDSSALQNELERLL